MAASQRQTFQLVLAGFFAQYFHIMSPSVHNLQKAIVSDQQSLTQLLRQTKLIAAKLNVEDVEQWVDLELNGYPKDADPPNLDSDSPHLHFPQL